MNETKEISKVHLNKFFTILKTRFEKNINRHNDLEWSQVESRILQNPSKLESLMKMENTGGEPDVVDFDSTSGEFIFFDCSSESPLGRRSLCYDTQALESRKDYKPSNSALDIAKEMGIEVLDETQYRFLQTLGSFDTKTSSWLKTPENIRKLGGAIFGDCRFSQVFIYHNGAESYYASRGFRGCLRV